MHRDGRTTRCARRPPSRSRRPSVVALLFPCTCGARSPRFRFTRRVLCPGVDVFAYGLMADGRARLMLNKEAGKPQHPLWRAGGRALVTAASGASSLLVHVSSLNTHQYSIHTYTLYESANTHIFAASEGYSLWFCIHSAAGGRSVL
jgi:hypothetical protein